MAPPVTPDGLITAWAEQNNAVVEVEQDDDGSGYTVLVISTVHGYFKATVDTTFVKEE
jgi:TusA-related sulfurtransferase